VLKIVKYVELGLKLMNDVLLKNICLSVCFHSKLKINRLKILYVYTVYI